jgi:serine/threonine-protein kinase CHEK2
MLVVDPEKRFTVDQCLSHPWITQKPVNVNDSTDGLVAGIGGLDVQRRGPVRERTLLSSINSVQLTHKVPMGPNQHRGPVKVYQKNPSADRTNVTPMEARPDDPRSAQEFVQMGGKGDQELFGDDRSFYSKSDAAAAKSNGKGKGKANGR